MNKDVLTLRLDLANSMYPRLYSSVQKVPPRMRSEKIRQLAALGEMVESGLIDNIGQMIISKLPRYEIPLITKNGDENKIEGDDNFDNKINPDDFADFE